LLLDKGTEFFLGGLLGLFGLARPRLVGAALLQLDGLSFGLELLSHAALFSGVTVVPAMHLAEVGVVRITIVAIAVVVVATVLLLGGLLLVVAIVVDNGALAIHRFSIFKAFHEVDNFTESVVHRVPVLLLHLNLPAVGSGKEEDVNDFVSHEHLVGSKGRQLREFIKDHVQQMVVERADLHVGWLAASATQVPLSTAEDVLRHEFSDHVIEGVTKDSLQVEACIIAVSDDTQAALSAAAASAALQALVQRMWTITSKVLRAVPRMH
jgi:hypothetical protein